MVSRNSIGARLERLEGQIPPPVDEGTGLRQAALVEVLEEFAQLKASRARGYRGGVPIEPEDIPGKVLGPSYTTGQMMELAIRRVLERTHETNPDILSRDSAERLIKRWADAFERWFTRQGRDWNKPERGV